MKNKVIRNGKVAVAISGGYGAGWSTWEPVSPFEPKVIKMIEANKQLEITPEWCKKELGVDCACRGVEDLEIVWIKKGTKFSINSYDGNESIYTESELEYIAKK